MCKFYSVIILCFCLHSCSKHEIQLPKILEEKISEITNCSCGQHINQYKWRNQKVFVLASSSDLCFWQPSYFNEDGSPILMERGYTYAHFLDESSLIDQVWECGK